MKLVAIKQAHGMYTQYPYSSVYLDMIIAAAGAQQTPSQ
jgi:hypothetical protein